MQCKYVLMLGVLLNLISINMCVAGPLIYITRRQQIKRNMERNVEPLQKEYAQKKFAFQAKISRHLEEVSVVMSKCGLSKKWQADYFTMRAQRAFKEGFYLVGGTYMEYAKKLRYDLNLENAKIK